MHIPLLLQQAIDEEVSLVKSKEMIQGRKKLSYSYRTASQAGKKPYISNEPERISYLATRMPATYAAILSVLQELCQRAPALQVQSLLDVGSGPGTALWAAQELFPHMQKVSLVERDTEMIQLGKRLFSKSMFPPIEWLTLDLEQSQSFTPHDLVICAYALSELSLKARKEVVASAFAAAQQMLVIIEPGTPVGYQSVLQMRDELLGLGAHVAAPCPHSLACPLKEGDWCHFSARVERSSLHRKVKEASLGYEDEKFSYLIVSKRPMLLLESRVLRRPQKRSGHVRLMLCTKNGVRERIFSKKNGDLYKKARDLEWGDAF